jgi:hypothetical protein
VRKPWPFVKFILFLKEQPLDHPYYQERLAMLKVWADSGTYRALLGRRADPSADQLIEVVKIQAFELAPEGQTVDPYVLASDGDRQFLRTRYATAVRESEWKDFKPTEKGVDQPRAVRDGQPLFFEVWDANYRGDTLIGGFVVYPEGRDVKAGAKGERLAGYTANIQWDWRDPQTVSRAGFARVQVRFTRRLAPAGTGAVKAVGR